jgi:hypothetical protein
MRSILPSLLLFYAMSLFSLLAFPGCRKPTVVGVNNTLYGNFVVRRTVEEERESGSALGRRYSTRTYNLRYDLLYKGKSVRLPGPLQKGTGHNYLWQVHILADAPVPALLVGSQQLYLVTEEHHQVVVRRLTQAQTRFSSIQWLDGPDGLPGPERQTYHPPNDDRLDSSLVLHGGKHLLLNRFTVLNVATLQTFAFNKKGIWEVDGWHLVHDSPNRREAVVGFSEVHRQVVFRALKPDPQREGRYYAGLFAFNYAEDYAYLVPFDRHPLHLQHIDDLGSQQVQACFAWNAAGRLEIRPDFVPAPWQGTLVFPDAHLIGYELAPVAAPMLTDFLAYLQHTYKLPRAGKNPAVVDETVAGSTRTQYRVRIHNALFWLYFDRSEGKVSFTTHFMASYTDAHGQVIREVAENFNRLLAAGNYQQHFTRFGHDAGLPPSPGPTRAPTGNAKE